MPRSNNVKSCAWLLSSLLGVVAADALAQEAKKPEKPEPAVLFGELDANHDGFVEASEVPAGVRASFDALVRHGDADHDGKLAGKEYAALLEQIDEPAKKKAARPLQERLKAMDADGDGRVSRAEFKGRPAGFNRLDVNQDGFIDRADRKAAQAKKAADAAKAKDKAKDDDKAK
jgi:Ca2+-binding EF-hand superfamily protein